MSDARALMPASLPGVCSFSSHGVYICWMGDVHSLQTAETFQLLIPLIISYSLEFCHNEKNK